MKRRKDGRLKNTLLNEEIKRWKLLEGLEQRIKRQNKQRAGKVEKNRWKKDKIKQGTKEIENNG